MNNPPTTPTNDTTLPMKRSESDQDDPLVSPSPKREKMDPSYYFEDTDPQAQAHEDAVDFAMELLQREHDDHDPREPSLEFSLAPHRGEIGVRSTEFVSQICATVKACELPSGDAFARAPVDIVVALDVSGSMASTEFKLHGIEAIIL